MTKKLQGIMDTHVKDVTMSGSHSVLSITMANTISLEGCDYAVHGLLKMCNKKLLMLC
jgi:hypothetical protein